MVNKSAVRKSGYIFEYRLAFLGASKTGKTSVLNRFVSDTFTHRYRPTVEDHTTHIMDHNGNMCVCLMVDTCGSCDFPAMRRLAITKGNAFLVFYSINDRKTFEVAKQTVTEIKGLKSSTEDVKLLIVGNKTDVESERQVQAAEGQTFVESINRDNVSSLFFECSAKNSQNVELLFSRLLDMFIPEEAMQEILPERSTFTRMSLRKKARKHRLEKQKIVVDLQQQSTNCYSDTNLSRHMNHHESTQQIPTGKLLRSSSVASGFGSSDSDGGTDTDTKQLTHKQKELKRQNTAKNLLKKTFGSVQKLLKSDHESVRRSSSADTSKPFPVIDNMRRSSSMDHQQIIHEHLERASTLDNTRIIYKHKKQTTL